MSTRLPPFRSSRQRYRRFVEDYLRGRLDEADKPGGSEQGPDVAEATQNGRFGRLRGLRPRGKRREYLGEYLRWLKPLRLAGGAAFLLALIPARLVMIETLFTQFIVL